MWWLAGPGIWATGSSRHRRRAIAGAAGQGALQPEHVGSEYIGWLHFQPTWGQLVSTEPDMFTGGMRCAG